MRKCAFCSSEAKLTGEHVWSAWIGKLLASKSSKQFNVSRKYRNADDARTWTQRTIDHKTKVVCKSCNEGWMSDLEGAAKATLSGIIRDAAPVSLLSRGVDSLAAFAFKCAVVADHTSPNGTPFFSPHIRHKFRECGEIPAGVRMWIAAFQGISRTSCRFNSYYSKPNAAYMGEFDFFVFTYAAGHLALQVVAPRWKRLHLHRRRLPRVIADSLWDATTVEFWPTPGLPLSWPPSRCLDDGSFRAFTDRFSRTMRVGLAVTGRTTG
jgi:hypothetical protein